MMRVYSVKLAATRTQVLGSCFFLGNSSSIIWDSSNFTAFKLSFSKLFFAEPLFHKLISSEIKLHFIAIHKILNSTKFLHKLLRDFFIQCLAIPYDVARFCCTQLNSCSQNWFAEQLALRMSDLRLLFTISTGKQLGF